MCGVEGGGEAENIQIKKTFIKNAVSTATFNKRIIMPTATYV